MKPILIILHQEHSTPAHVGRLLRAQGHALDIRKPRFGDALPTTLAAHDGAVIFGGPMSARDTDAFITQETDWLKIPLRENKPVLGICLGAQMLARHLGARVFLPPGGDVEIGYHTICPKAPPVPAPAPAIVASSLTTPANPAAMKKASGGAATLSPSAQTVHHLRPPFAWPTRVFQWHKEGFDCPRTAIELATAESPFPCQAFQYGSGVAIQFHPEITYQQVNRWSGKNPAKLAQPGAQNRPDQLRDHIAHAPIIHRWLDAVLWQWKTGSLVPDHTVKMISSGT